MIASGPADVVTVQLLLDQEDDEQLFETMTGGQGTSAIGSQVHEICTTSANLAERPTAALQESSLAAR